MDKSSIGYSPKLAKAMKLRSKSNWASTLPFLAGTLPFIPPVGALAAGLGGGYLAATAHNKINALLDNQSFDERYDSTFDIEDADVWRGTYLGQAMPFQTWREKLDMLRQTKGSITPNLRRQLAGDLFSAMKPLGLSDSLLTRHLCLQAPTGTGKTELYQAILYQQIKKGGGCIIVEAKSDSDFSGTAYRLAEECDRLDDLYIVNLEHPHMSHTWNPVMYGGVRQQINVLMQIQGNSSEEFWTDIARYSLSAGILALRLQPGQPAFHLKDLVAVLSDFMMMRDLVSSIRSGDSDDHRRGKEFLAVYLKYWLNEKDGAPDTQRYKTLLTGLVSKLSAYCHSEYASVLNTYSPDVDIKDAILNGKIVILSMSALADKDGSELLGRLFIADLARAVGEIQQEKVKPMVMCPALFDEYGSFSDASQINLFQLARSANVPIIIAMQGMGFLEEAGDKAFAENVMGNCWHHIYSDIKGETRQFAIDSAGTLIARLMQGGMAENIGSSQGSESSGLLTQDSEGTSISSGYREQRETLLQPDDFTDLDEGDAIMVGKSGVYRVRLPLVKLSTSPPHWNDMKLTRHPVTGRPGIKLWEKYASRCAEAFGIN